MNLTLKSFQTKQEILHKKIEINNFKKNIYFIKIKKKSAHVELKQK